MIILGEEVVAEEEDYSDLGKVNNELFGGFDFLNEEIQEGKKKEEIFPDLDKIEEDLLEEIKNCNLLISARFHAICLSLHFLAPFVAISSNTFKIESLLNDIGLGDRRIINFEDLNDFEKIKSTYNYFEKDEIIKINEYIVSANQKIELMFDEIDKTIVVGGFF